MLRTLILLSSVAIIVSGCAGATTRFYTLEPAPAGAVTYAGYAGAAYRVDAVHIPADLDRLELVRPGPGGRFTVSDNDHWAAPLGDLLQRTLTQDLAAEFPSGEIVFPQAPKPPGAGGIVVTILGLTYGDGSVAMDASWSVVAARPPVTTTAPADSAVRQRTLRVTAPVSGGGVADDAAQLSTLSAKLAVAIAADLNAPAQ